MSAPVQFIIARTRKGMPGSCDECGSAIVLDDDLQAVALLEMVKGKQVNVICEACAVQHRATAHGQYIRGRGLHALVPGGHGLPPAARARCGAKVILTSATSRLCSRLNSREIPVASASALQKFWNI